MDPQTAYLIATMMMLANGGVLGLMRRDLPKGLRPAAASWRIGTLLIAGASVLFTVQNDLPPAFILPIINGLALLGFTGYWRALRQFYGKPESWWLLVPATVGVATVFLFAAPQPAYNILIRIVVISLAWLVIFGGCIAALRIQHRDQAISRRVLTGLFLAEIIFMSFRAVWYIYAGLTASVELLSPASWLNLATPLMLAVLPVIGTTAFVLLCSERLRRQWERAASTDYLTGLANRRTMTDAGTSRFSSSRQGQGRLALAVVDIDHFKSVNDNYGHDVGDSALKHVAARLEAACREQELPARQGGEEFVVLLDGVDADGAHAAGERLRQSVEAVTFADRELSLKLTVSIGVAVLREDDADFDNLLRRADVALYAAKASGRNRVEVAV
jgi:diguanylate cyclase (GGDEF)-like protein